MNILPDLKHRLKADDAFSLTELMVVIGLVLIFATLAFPVMGRLSERSKAQLCASRIRQSGLLLQTHIADSSNVLHVYYGGDNASDLWTRKLIRRGYTTKQAGAKVFRCPSGKTSPGKPTDESIGGEGWLYECYGLVMMDAKAVTWTFKHPPLVRWATLRVALVEAPASYPLLADSATFTSGTQFHRIGHYLNNGDSSFALRHRQRANVFFLDGHIEPISLQRAEDLGLPNSYLQLQE